MAAFEFKKFENDKIHTNVKKYKNDNNNEYNM
jgi:hypothetical protein